MPTIGNAPAGAARVAGKGGKDSRAGKTGSGSRPAPRADAPVTKARKGTSGPIDRLPAGMVQSESAKNFAETTSVSMVPASGDQRSRLVRSAKRLVGIRKSFDTRSFLGHLLAICDMLPGAGTSVAWTVVDQMNLARDAGMYREAPAVPIPGDIAYFRCPSGCGADSGNGFGSGVVVDVQGGVYVIAYIEGVVSRIELTGALEPIGYSAP